MIANHISARVPGKDGVFYINPYGLLYEQMHASCFIELDLDGNVVFNPTEYGINQAGFVLHSAVHRARHDVDCVIHTHTLAGMAVSAMKCGLLPLAQTAMRFVDVGYHDYEGVALNLEEQARVVRDLGSRDAMILRNHGLLVCGPSIPEAFNNIFRLERACQLQVMALSCNTELSMPPRDLVEATSRLYQPGVRRRFGVMEWPALLEKLDSIDPSFRD
ncbi:MAG: class II aldolase/adducin family protein, partial [Stellaceae bacterium]